MKRTIFLASCLLLVAFELQAAPRVRIPKVIPAKVASSLRTPKLPRYVGARGAAMGVNYHSVVRATAKASELSSVRKAPWLTQQVRNFQAWQLKRTVRKQNLAFQKSQQYIETLELAKAALPPLLPERAFTVTDLADHTPALKLLENIPDIPFVEETQTTAYRGLALSTEGDAIRNILSNGMLTKDVSQDSNTYLRVLSAGSRGSLRQLYLYPSISITHSPLRAAEWGKMRLQPNDRPLLTVVKMKGDFQGKHMEFIMDDIPSSQIEEVVVLLNINDRLTWCKAQLNPDNTLTLTPYQSLYSPK